jgi:hypothetical protein
MIYKLFSLLVFFKKSNFRPLCDRNSSSLLYHSEYNNIYFLYTIQYFFYFFTKIHTHYASH